MDHGQSPNIYTAIVEQRGSTWFGRIEQVPGIDCRADSPEQLRVRLQQELRNAISFYQQDARNQVGESHEFWEITV